MLALSLTAQPAAGRFYINTLFWANVQLNWDEYNPQKTENKKGYNMNQEQIFDEIRSLLVQLFELNADDIKLESKLYEELDLDSIDAVDLVVHLQKKTGKKINPETFKSVRTVQDVVVAIEELLKS